MCAIQLSRNDSGTAKIDNMTITSMDVLKRCQSRKAERRPCQEGLRNSISILIVDGRCIESATSMEQ